MKDFILLLQLYLKEQTIFLYKLMWTISKINQSVEYSTITPVLTGSLEVSFCLLMFTAFFSLLINMENFKNQKYKAKQHN